MDPVVAVVIVAVASVGGLAGVALVLTRQINRLVSAVVAKHAPDLARIESPSAPPARTSRKVDELSVVEQGV